MHTLCKHGRNGSRLIYMICLRTRPNNHLIPFNLPYVHTTLCPQRPSHKVVTWLSTCSCEGSLQLLHLLQTILLRLLQTLLFSSEIVHCLLPPSLLRLLRSFPLSSSNHFPLFSS